MNIFCWTVGFKIKSKADARKLLNMKNESDFGHCETDFYWTDGERDYYISPGEQLVYQRFCSERGNPFSPYWQVLDPVETIWKTRKYINDQYFCRERW